MRSEEQCFYPLSPPLLASRVFMCGLINQIVSPGVSSNVFLFLPGIPPPFPVMLKDSLHLGVEEAVGESHHESLGGEEEGTEVGEYRVGD